jgi:hypothetical protein
MTADDVNKEFDKAIIKGPATIQIITGRDPEIPPDPKIISELFDHFQKRAESMGWLVARVTLSEEADKYPGMPIHYHLADALRDWLKPGAANSKLLGGILKARGTDRMPCLLLIDGSEFPEDQRLLSAKEQIRAISNRQSEYNLWIVFALDPRTAQLGPSVASESYYDFTLGS